MPALQHISISPPTISGLAAKPVIDILLEVVDLDELDILNPVLANAGYTARGECGIPNRRYFSKSGDLRTHHIHAFVSNDEHIIKLLAFRNYLIKHKDVAKQYAEIKRSAVLACENDIRRYSVFKAGFMEHHLRLALMDPEQQFS